MNEKWRKLLCACGGGISLLGHTAAKTMHIPGAVLQPPPPVVEVYIPRIGVYIAGIRDKDTGALMMPAGKNRIQVDVEQYEHGARLYLSYSAVRQPKYDCVICGHQGDEPCIHLSEVGGQAGHYWKDGPLRGRPVESAFRNGRKG